MLQARCLPLSSSRQWPPPGAAPDRQGSLAPVSINGHEVEVVEAHDRNSWLHGEQMCAGHLRALLILLWDPPTASCYSINGQWPAGPACLVAAGPLASTHRTAAGGSASTRLMVTQTIDNEAIRTLCPPSRQEPPLQASQSQHVRVAPFSSLNSSTATSWQC